jgi:hypothetical protein
MAARKYEGAGYSDRVSARCSIKKQDAKSRNLHGEKLRIPGPE